MTVFTYPPKEEKIDYENLNLDSLVLSSTPPLGAETYDTVFKKFGYCVYGVCEKWVFYDNWKENSDEDKWKFVALCSLTWEKFYKWLNDKEEYKNYKRHLLNESKEDLRFLQTLERLERLEYGTQKWNFRIEGRE